MTVGAVELLLRQLKRDTPHTIATLLIDPENVRSLMLAHRLGLAERRLFARDV